MVGEHTIQDAVGWDNALIFQIRFWEDYKIWLRQMTCNVITEQACKASGLDMPC